jgi:signal peptidase II
MRLPAIVLFTGCLLSVVNVDQAAKTVVCRRLALAGSVQLGRYLRITHGENRGSGWLALSRTPAVALFASLISLAAVLVTAGPPLGAVSVVGLGLALGGAGGNLVDRIARKSVRDFIGVGKWPLFNLADVALTLGVCLTPLGLL